MKVKVNIINTRCIIMSEAVTVTNLMMMTLILSFRGIACEGQTHTKTQTQTWVGILT